MVTNKSHAYIYIYIFIYLFIYLFIYFYVYMYIYLFIYVYNICIYSVVDVQDWPLQSSLLVTHKPAAASMCCPVESACKASHGGSTRLVFLMYLAIRAALL